MKKFIYEVIFILILFLTLYLFGGDPVAIAKEIVILYLVLFTISVGLIIFIGWSLTKAMNPKCPSKENDDAR